MSRYLLKGGRVIDPSRNLDVIQDVLIDGEKISNEAPNGSEEVIDVSGLVVSPGLIDIHVHLREPGGSAKETIRTGTRSAVAGGFTSVVAMPNTTPPVDGANTVAWMMQRTRETGVCKVFPTGCISKDRKGEVLAPIGSLKKAGVVAISDDGSCVQSNELMRRALEYCKMFDLPVMDHCQDEALTKGAVMHEGYWSVVLGLRGWPRIAEEVIVSRNALLAEMTGAHVHCQHLSSFGSVRILREARRRGISISGEVCPHHIALTDESIQGYDTNFKMNPPLRGQKDIDALLEGIADGTIEYLGSDHAPHCSYEKEVEFDHAPFGIVGLETELPLFLTHLVHKKILTLPELIRRLTQSAAKLLKLEEGTLQPGKDADITVFDPDMEWTVDKTKFYSASQNTPFHGTVLKGRAVYSFVRGRKAFDLRSGFIAG